MHQLDQECAEWKIAAVALADRPTHYRSSDPSPPPRPIAHLTPSLGHPCGVLLTLEAQYLDLGSNDLCWPGRACEARRHRDLLRAVRHIGNHAACDRAAELLAPEFLAGGGVERVEIAADVAEEHDASGRRGQAADDWVVGFQAPLPDAGVGVGGVEPSSPVSVRSAEFAEHVEGIPGCHPHPWGPDRRRSQLIDILWCCAGTPIHLAVEYKVGLRIVAGTVPFLAAHRTWAEMDGLAGLESCRDILDLGHRHLVELAIVGAIEAIKVSVLRGDNHELLAASGLDQDRRVGDVPVVPVFQHNLEIAFVVTGLGIEHDDRVGVEIFSLAHADYVIWCGIATRDVEQPGLRIERV